MKQADKTLARIEKLTQVLKDKTFLLIVMQDNPDPDSIAAAVALRRCVNTIAGLQCSIAHGGTIGRGENRALVRYLGLNLHRLEDIDYLKFDAIAMVDTQPGTGNNSLPEEHEPEIVIDHHPCRRTTRTLQFMDVRGAYGATATILFEYLVAANVTIDPPLATALLYGIRSDTQDLGREATGADIKAIETLYPMANKKMLSDIQRGSVPRVYFQMLGVALKNARIYGSAIITTLGRVDNPDMIGEVADLLMREDKTTWTMCMGLFEGKMLLSIRTSEPEKDAGKITKRLVARRGTGGGHQSYAGGQITLKQGTEAEFSRMEKVVRQKFVRLIRLDENRPVKLIET